MDVPVALVGCGRWGRNHARNLAELGALALVCDSDPHAEVPEGVRRADGFKEVLADPDVRAVVLATPASTHAAMGLAAIQAGKDVLVEKPLALSYDEGRRLVDAAAAAGAVLMVGHVLLYHPAVEALRGLVADGDLGDLRYLYSNRLNLGTVRAAENILWSFAPHDIAVMNALVGAAPVEVAASGGAYLQEGIADVTVTDLLYPGDVRAHIFVSWLHPFKEHRLVVIGDRKMAAFTDTDLEGTLRLYDRGVDIRDGVAVVREAPESAIDVPDAEPMRAELLHFLSCVVERTRPRTDGEEGLEVLRVLEACQRSLDEGGRVVALEDVRA
jgi:UDP-2-acetamido-3-amino-2,3-dideoxy-glucuronate N-acetyltransferase